MNAVALLNAFKNCSFASDRTISNNLIVFDSKILFRIRSAMFSWKISFKAFLLMTDENSCSVNRMFWLIKETNISLSKLKNCIWDKTELAADETTLDLFNWLIFSTYNVLREVTEAIFEIENLKTTVLVEKVKMLISVVSTLLAVIEEFSTKSSSKETFAWKSFINLIFLIIKSAARRFFRVDAKRSE